MKESDGLVGSRQSSCEMGISPGIECGKCFVLLVDGGRGAGTSGYRDIGKGKSMNESRTFREPKQALEARYAYYRRCQAVKKNGEQCKAPAVRGEQICCKHGLQQDMQQRWRRQREALGLQEGLVDRRSVLKALEVVAQALVENRVDEKLAGRLFWELGIKSSALPKGACTAEARRRGEKQGDSNSGQRAAISLDPSLAPELPFPPLSTAELRRMSRKDIEAYVMENLRNEETMFRAAGGGIRAAGSASGVAGKATGVSPEASNERGTHNNLVHHLSR